ncbi:MAG: N-acetylmuramoyl-L-alanine amidase family protein [Fimbriimonadaceae bacterium]
MKRFAAWVAWMATAALAHGAQGRPAYVNFGFSGVSPSIAFRVGDECFISTTMPTPWGWQVERTHGSKYRITVDDDTVEATSRHMNGEDMLPLTEITRSLDVDAHWRPHTDVLDVTGLVRVIRLMNGHLFVSASMAVLPHVVLGSRGDRMTIDLLGASLSPDAIVDVAPGLVVTTPKPGSIRIELPVQGKLALDPHVGEPTRELDIDTTVVSQVQTPTSGAVEETLQVDHETENSITLSMPLPARLPHAPNVARLDASTLRVWLPGVKVLLSPSGATSPSIKNAQADLTPAGTELVFQLIRPMGVTISTEHGLQLRFVKPPVGNGHLAGKVIVVDAGHGGHDSGTKALSDGLAEKTLTLPIAKMLAADLAAQGATVIMTRQTDVFIPLTERAAIANRNHAAMFLCVHINSNGRNTSTSGSITFYHNADPVSSTLADCIERQLPAASGIPAIGIWSDTKIYDIGFSVLRNIKMPGVLMELGFMNNANDRPKLTKKSVQEAMAAAIVKGVKVYLGQPSADEN